MEIPKYTHQIDLIELHLNAFPVLTRCKYDPSSPRDVHVVLGIRLKSIVHATVQHDLVLTAEEDMCWRVFPGGDVRPEAVA